jgi:hypothetical protein
MSLLVKIHRTSGFLGTKEKLNFLLSVSFCWRGLVKSTEILVPNSVLTFPCKFSHCIQKLNHSVIKLLIPKKTS